MTFTDHFLTDTVEILRQLDVSDVESVVATIAATRERGGRLFFCGSGGGAGHASHAACDFRKLAGIESYCVSDNVSELTARINDDGWDTAYAEWLRVSGIRGDDCLFVFSVGGGCTDPPVSVNLVNAVRLAIDVGAYVVGVVGRDGGALRELATASILVPTVDPKLVTPQTEGLQALFWHLVVSHPDLATNIAKWEGLDASSGT
jgi:D-sedoheptulose 7-phosphate isomerase|tara:strand:- start:127 stop:738 length:612 start_codon:yes stop_codon:yes gene_type:complete